MKEAASLVLSVVLAFGAHAQDVPKESLSQITSETALLKAKAAQAEAQRLAVGDAGLPANVDLPGAPPAPAQWDATDAPVFLGVFGPPKAPYARVKLPNGSTVKARSGEVLPGGRWLVEITPGGGRISPVRARKH